MSIYQGYEIEFDCPKCNHRHRFVDSEYLENPFKFCNKCKEFIFDDVKLLIERTRINKQKFQKKLDYNLILYMLHSDDEKEKAYGMIADYFIEQYHPKTLRDDEKEEIWIYKEGIYIPHGKSYLKEEMKKGLKNFYTTFKFNRVCDLIVPSCFICAEDFFDYNIINEVPLENGILNIKTRELSEFTPNKYFFNKLPVKYDPDATCDKIDKFLHQIVQKEDDVKCLYEFFGFGLRKDYFLEKSFLLSGNGRNGKSVFLRIVENFFSKKNISNLTFKDMESSDNFNLCELHNKYINMSGDLSNTKIKETGIFKSLTGGDMIKAARKFMRPVYFTNYAKMIFNCNEAPRSTDNSEGFWRRWVLIDFPYKFVKKSEYDETDPKQRIAIPKVEKAFIVPEEMSGLLNKALDALERILENKSFSDSDASKDIKRKWAVKSDSLEVFCEEYVEEDFTSKIAISEFIKAYERFCSNYNAQAQSTRTIFKHLKRIYKEIKKIKSNSIAYYNGIKLKLE